MLVFALASKSMSNAKVAVAPLGVILALPVTEVKPLTLEEATTLEVVILACASKSSAEAAKVDVAPDKVVLACASTSSNAAAVKLADR
jgi:hypothetical protein